MSAIDEFLEHNKAFAESFDKGDLPLPPAKKVAIVALHGRAAQPVSDPRPVDRGTRT